MLFATERDSTQLRAITHGLAIEFAAHHAVHIANFAHGSMLADEFFYLVAEIIRWENPVGLARLIRHRIEPYEDRLTARTPIRMLPQLRLTIDRLVAEGQVRGEAIHKSIVPALICSLLPECEPRLHTVTAHELLAAAAEWSNQGAQWPDRSATQFVETVGLILGRPDPAIDYLFCDGRMKEALMRGSARWLTLDDGQQRRFGDISEFIHWLS